MRSRHPSGAALPGVPGAGPTDQAADTPRGQSNQESSSDQAHPPAPMRPAPPFSLSNHAGRPLIVHEGHDFQNLWCLPLLDLLRAREHGVINIFSDDRPGPTSSTSPAPAPPPTSSRSGLA